jgi:hypothetical protein
VLDASRAAVNPIRSIVAVLAGMGFVSILVEVLEFTLVNAVAGGSITDLAGYFAVRNRPGMLGAQLGYNAVAALLGGYLTARVAGGRELLHAGISGGLKTTALAWGFVAGEYAELTPVWMRIALILMTGPAMLAGASIRARAVRSNT